MEQKDQIDRQRRQQHFDDRVAKALQQLPKKAVFARAGQLVIAVQPAGLFRFGGGEPCG